MSIDITGGNSPSGDQGRSFGLTPLSQDMSLRLRLPKVRSDADLRRTPHDLGFMDTARALLREFGFNNNYDQSAVSLASRSAVRSPFLLFDMSIVSDKISLWKETMRGLPAYFAIKSCSATEVILKLNANGFNFDAATDGELEYLESLGIPGDRVLRTRPICAQDNMELLQRYKPKAVVIENIEGLEILKKGGIPNSDYQPVILLRLEIGIGNLQKFGCPCATDIIRETHVITAPGKSKVEKRVTTAYDHRPALKILRHAQSIEDEMGVRFGAFGLTAHVGTNTTDPNVYGLLFGIYDSVSKPINEGLAISTNSSNITSTIGWFDIGGGFPDTEYSINANTSQREVLESISLRLERFKSSYARRSGITPHIVAEPGRYLVADAGASISRVIGTEKRTEYRLPNGNTVKADNMFVRLDDGVYGSLMGKIHDDKLYQPKPFRIYEKEEPFIGELTVCKNIWGPTCDSVDGIRRADQTLISPDTIRLPSDLRSGDCFMVPYLGAYSLVTATQFNDTTPPNCIFVERLLGGAFTYRVYDTSARHLITEGKLTC
jgi:ornithine decarboxylase